MARIEDGGAGVREAPGHSRLTLRDGLLANAVKVLAGVYVVSVLLWAIASAHLPIEAHVPILAGGLLAIIFTLVLFGLHQHGHPRFGYANIVTAVRAGLVSLVGAVVLFSDAFGEAKIDVMVWATAGCALFALSLDGVDGYLARRFRQQSVLGARFDMEVDAFLIFILSVAAAVLGKAGPWVILIGAMRYLFVAFQMVLPELRMPLAESFRRKLVCVVQVGVLCAVMLPIIAPPLSTVLCAIALILLVYSFGVDTAYLLQKRERNR
jgi:phosphatidylglycerophosphate synthase